MSLVPPPVPAKWLDKTHVGDARKVLRQMIREKVQVQMIVTSPPYWNLRDYGVKGQIGLERSLQKWVDTMVQVGELMRKVLRDDGTLWLNLGDSYAQQGGPGWQGKHGARSGRRFTLQRNQVMRKNARRPPLNLKPKDMMGQPWRVAFALQDAGWWLRRDIIWHKRNPMPESMRDRPHTAHEYIFLLSKSESYYYDDEAISEAVTGNAHPRGNGVNPKAGPRIAGWADGDVKHTAKDHAREQQGLRTSGKFGRGAGWRQKQNASFSGAVTDTVPARAARSVWSMASEPASFAHFATFPSEVPKRAILAGSRPGDVILDPFMGSGTTASAATGLGRHYIGIELNPESVQIQKDHRDMTIGMPL